MSSRSGGALGYLTSVALIAAAITAAAAEPAAPTANQVLALTRGYLAAWQAMLASLVVEEDLRQEVTHYNASGRATRLVQRRRLRSELLLLRAPAENVWLSFRDVMAVDGKAVHDRQKRFDQLFSGPTALVQSTAERIAEEGFRFNLGRLQRTINTPTAGLVFLDPIYHANTSWTVEPDKRFKGRRVWHLRFDQRAPPYSVRVPNSMTPVSKGRFWLDPATGAILRWDVTVRAGTATFEVSTTYGVVPSVREGLVPVRLEEHYDAVLMERLHGIARYSNHRLFRTTGRIIQPGT